MGGLITNEYTSVRGEKNDADKGIEGCRSQRKIEDWLALVFVAAFAAIAAWYPTVRAFYHFEVNYNEGWNLYNAVAVAHHVPLYGTKFGWTTVNYPILSFYVVSYLSRFTHDYLLTGRLLSLLSTFLSCVLVGFIVRKITGTISSALFGALFCLALFCACVSSYVGANDPQMLAQVIFLSGLLLYLSRPPTLGGIATVAVLFAVGGNVKHNLIAFPLAVFLDLYSISRRKAFQFAFLLGVFACISVVFNTIAGGPFFVSNLLAGRSYSILRALLDFAADYLPLCFPLIAASVWAIKKRNEPTDRPIAYFFLVSLLMGIALGGGQGVSTNAYFDNFLSMSMIVGIIFHSVSQTGVPGFSRLHFRKWSFAGLILACLIFALFLSGDILVWRPMAVLQRDQAQFDREVSFLSNRPGPTICESLLRCYAAGKPYVYDPFNSQRFMRAGKLDSNEIVAKIRAHEFASIQLSLPVKSFRQLGEQMKNAGLNPVSYATIQLGPFGALSERFPETVLNAIDANYVLWIEAPDCDIYIPRSDSANDVRLRLTDY